MKRASQRIVQMINTFFLVLVFGMFLLTLCTTTREQEVLLIRLSRKELFLYIFLWGIVLGILYWLARKLKLFIEHYETIVTGLLFGMFFIGMAFAGYILAMEGAGDVAKVYHSAIALAHSGDLGKYQEYFYLYPNNLGATMILAGWLKLTFFVANPMIQCVIFNMLVEGGSLFFVWRMIRKQSGVVVASWALGCMILFFPLYMYAPIFYTDSIGMFFCAGTIWFYFFIREKDKQGGSQIRIKISYIVCGFFLGVGCAVKMSLLVIAIAILLHGVLIENGKRKCNGVFVLVGVFFALAILKLCQMVLLPDQELREKRELPVEHWIMMGLEGDGRYNEPDEEFSMSFQDKDVAAMHNREEIVQRIKGLGFLGIVNLLVKKTLFSFTDGTMNLGVFFDDLPLRNTKLHGYVYYRGDYYMKTYYLCTAYWIVLLFLAFLLAVKHIKWNTDKDNMLFLARLCWIGIWCFLMLWESNSRLVMCFVPVLFACALCLPEKREMTSDSCDIMKENKTLF